MSELNTEELVRRFMDIVGEDNVHTEGEKYEDFKDPYEPDDADDHQPLFVVQPANVEEVQKVVKLAGEMDIHIWTSSTGRNYGYGGSAPLVNKSIVVNLRRMDDVLEINEKDGYALVEPGVTFFDLYNEIRVHEYNLMMSVPDIAWGSVVGNTTQHGYGYTINGEHAKAVVGLEVVLSDGEVMRTGHGAKSDSPMWQRHKRAFGPAIDDLFMQSNFGIITKMGIRLEPKPEKMTTGFIYYDGDEIEKFIHLIRPLVMDRTIQGVPVLYNNPRYEDVDDRQKELFNKADEGGLRQSTRWAMRLSFFGRKEMVEARKNVLSEALSSLPGIEIDLVTYDGDASPEELETPEHLVPLGMPTMLLLDQARASFGEDMGHIEFAPRIPFDAEEYKRIAGIIQEKAAENGLFVDILTGMHERSMVLFGMIYFDSNNDDQIKTAHRIVKQLIEEVGDLGYTEYRGHVAIMEDIAAAFDFNDHALNKFYTKIKDAVDPKGILSPGSHGIWPSVLKNDQNSENEETR